MNDAQINAITSTFRENGRRDHIFLPASSSSRSTGGLNLVLLLVVLTKLQNRNSISSRSRMNLDSLKLDSLKLDSAAEAG